MKKRNMLFVFLLLAPVLLFSQSVTFSPQRGFFTAPFQLTLTPVIGGTIRYTTDGSAPTTTSGTIYTDPISISTTAVIRAVEYNGTTVTPVMTNTYLFINDIVNQPANIAGWPNNKYALGAGTDSVFHDYQMDPNVVNNPLYTAQLKEGLTDIPTLSVVMNKADFWTMYDGDNEFPTSVELIYPKNPSLNEQFNCGIESHSHLRLKRSMRLVIKSAYFPNSLQSNIFKNAPLNGSNAPGTFTKAKIVLRAGNNRSWARNWNPDRTCYTRDQWYRDAMIDIAGVGSHGTFVHLYVNGLYWGLYNPVERLDAGFESQNMGGAYADWMAFSEDGVRSGDATRFNYLNGTLVNKDMTDPLNYTELQQYLDLKNFSDYMLGTWYTGMSDWPNNNYSGGNRNNPIGPEMFYAWDCEWSWDVTNGSNNGAWVHPAFRNDQAGSGLVTNLWHSARRNSDFMTLFADRVYKHCFTNGKLTDIRSRERWQLLNNFISKAIVAESARWGDAVGDGVTRTKDGYWTPEVTRVDNLMNGNVQRFITALRQQGYYPSIDPPAFSNEGGPLTTGTSLALTNPNGAGTIYYTVNGDDPRSSGGNVSASANIYAGPISISDGNTVKARVKNGDTWSALHEGTYTLTANHAPVLTAIGSKTANVGQPLTFTASATDADAGQTLHYSLVAAPNGATINPGSGNFSWTPTETGTYTFLVSVSDNGDNPMSDDEQISVTVNGPLPPLAVSTFTLVNADNEQDLQTLTDGATLNLAALPTRNLNIRANTNPVTVGSVVFALSGTQTRAQTETASPYALFGDNSGNYNAWTPAVGTYTLVGTPYAGSGGTGTAGKALTTSFTIIDQPLTTNQPPVANAGTTQTITLPTSSVVLSGSGTDADGSIAGYTWSQVSGPSTATFSSKTVAAPTVSGLVQGTYVFALVVTDNGGASSAASQVSVVVNPAPSVQAVSTFTLVNADNEQDLQTLTDGATLNLAALPTRNLNIRANTNPVTVGSVVFALSGTQTRAQTETASPYALFGDNSGNYNAWTPAVGTYTLVGTPYAGSGGTGTAGKALTTSFTIIDQPLTTNQPPVANAGTTQTITLPTSSVVLSGSGTDADGSIAGYTWSQVSGPSTATFSSKTVAAPTVSGLVQGTYVFALVVTDNGGASSAASQVSVVVNAAANKAPVANAGPDQTITLPTSSLTLSGSGTDADGTVVGYTWSQVSGPSTATFSSKTAQNPTVSGLVQGTYVFALVVTDNGGASSPADQVSITVNGAPSTQAVTTYTLVNAETDQDLFTLSEGTTIGLASLPTKKLNIRANTTPLSVGSVRLVLSGAQNQSTTDNTRPYAVFGDNNGNYKFWTPSVGSYTLTGTPYTGANASGTAGTPLTLHFTVSKNAAITQLSEQMKEPTIGELQLTAYPNPSATGVWEVVFSEAVRGAITYELFTINGSKLTTGTQFLPSLTNTMHFDFRKTVNINGLYLLRINTAQQKRMLKIVFANNR